MNPILFQNAGALIGLSAGGTGSITGDGGGNESPFALLLAGFMSGEMAETGSTVSSRMITGDSVTTGLEAKGALRLIQAVAEIDGVSALAEPGEPVTMLTIPAALSVVTGEGSEEPLPVLLLVSGTDTGGDAAISILTTGEQAEGITQLLGSEMPVKLHQRDVPAEIDQLPIVNLFTLGMIPPREESQGVSYQVDESGNVPIVPSIKTPIIQDDESQVNTPNVTRSSEPAEEITIHFETNSVEPKPIIHETDSLVRIPVRVIVTYESDILDTEVSVRSEVLPQDRAFSALSENEEPTLHQLIAVAQPEPNSDISYDPQPASISERSPASDANIPIPNPTPAHDSTMSAEPKQIETLSLNDSTNELLELLSQDGSVTVVLDRQTTPVIRNMLIPTDLIVPDPPEISAPVRVPAIDTMPFEVEHNIIPADSPTIQITMTAEGITSEATETTTTATLSSLIAAQESSTDPEPMTAPVTPAPIRIARGTWPQSVIPIATASSDNHVLTNASNSEHMPVDTFSRSIRHSMGTEPSAPAHAPKPVGNAVDTGTFTANQIESEAVVEAPEISLRKTISMPNALNRYADSVSPEGMHSVLTDMTRIPLTEASTISVRLATSVDTVQTVGEGDTIGASPLPHSPAIVAFAEELPVSVTPDVLSNQDVQPLHLIAPQRTIPMVQQSVTDQSVDTETRTVQSPQANPQVSTPPLDRSDVIDTVINSESEGIFVSSTENEAQLYVQTSIAPSDTMIGEAMSTDGTSPVDTTITGRNQDGLLSRSSDKRHWMSSPAASEDGIDMIVATGSMEDIISVEEQPTTETMQSVGERETVVSRIITESDMVPVIPIGEHTAQRIERSTYRSETLRERPAGHSRTATVSGGQRPRSESRPVIPTETGTLSTRTASGEPQQHNFELTNRHDTGESYQVFDSGAEPVSLGIQGAAMTMDTPDTRLEPHAGPIRHIMTGRMPSVDPRLVTNTVVRHARIMLRQGESSARIQLEPPHLGKLQLDIVTEHSKVTGKITVESAEVRDMIQNNISLLRDSLAQNGLKVESFDVEVGHNGGTDSWAHMETVRQQAQGRENMQRGYRREVNETSSSILGSSPVRRGSPGNSTYFDRWI